VLLELALSLTAAGAAVAESEGKRQRPQMNAEQIAQPHQRRIHRRSGDRSRRRLSHEPLVNSVDRRRAALQVLRHHRHDDRQQRVHPGQPPAHPAHRAGQADRHGAQCVGTGLHAARALGGSDDLLDLRQGARKPGRQMIGQQAECLVTPWAIPASDVRSRRALALVGAVAGEPTAPMRVQRTAFQPCLAPEFSGTVLLAGKPRMEPKLHRHRARGECHLRGPTFLCQRKACKLKPCRAGEDTAAHSQAVDIWTMR